MILEKVPVSLRGELTRWLIEPHAGVFVGHVNARVRDKLWEKCCQAKRTGGIARSLPRFDPACHMNNGIVAFIQKHLACSFRTLAHRTVQNDLLAG